MTIKFNAPDISSKELDYARESLLSGRLSGDGPFTGRCHQLLQANLGSPVLLTHSCTAALEMGAILADLQPGDEVIMPSFTFVSTANAVVLRGAVPVFVDIREDTLNLDETQLDKALSERTRAIMPVHYAGVGCAMDAIMDFARAHSLVVIEDAAQCYKADYNGRPLGTFGQLGCLSFHETKNVVSGEGGALIINDPEMVDRANYIREKGTNRTQFLRREVTKYEWIDIGSSFLPSDLIAAVLLAQLERADEITRRRFQIWTRLAKALQPLEEDGVASLPSPPQHAAHNAHVFYLLGRDAAASAELRKRLVADGVGVSSHYVPLHSSVAGRRFGRAVAELPVTDRVAATMVRLPMHALLTDDEVDRVIERTNFHAREITAGR